MFDAVGRGAAPSPGPADADPLTDMREEDLAEDPDDVRRSPYDDTGAYTRSSPTRTDRSPGPGPRPPAWPGYATWLAVHDGTNIT